MTKKIRIVVCDDHTVFREGVKIVLATQPDFEVIGETGDGKHAIDLVLRLQPDIALLDISMPLVKGFDAARRIRKRCPDVKVLILTVYDDEDLVARCLDAGAAGYVLKDTPPMQLIYAINAVHKGERYISPRALTAVVKRYIAQPAQPKTGYSLLSEREREVMVLLAEGVSMKEIARRLNLSVKTVDAHKYNLMRKLDVHDRSELIRYAVRNKLVEV
jgi:DNA-binding NarL/FixJ family response regulator